MQLSLMKNLEKLIESRFDEKELNNMEVQIDNQDLPEREKYIFCLH